MDQANAFITEALSSNQDGEKGGAPKTVTKKNKVLVHGFAGKSRAVAFLLGYLMKVRKVTLAEGMAKIRQVRPVAAPNPGFMLQLKALEKSIFGQNSEGCEII